MPGTSDFLFAGPIDNHFPYPGSSHQQIEESGPFPKEVTPLSHLLIGVYHIFQMYSVPALNLFHRDRCKVHAPAFFSQQGRILGARHTLGSEGKGASLEHRMSIHLERVLGAAPQGECGSLKGTDAGIEIYAAHVGQVGTGCTR